MESWASGQDEGFEYVLGYGFQKKSKKAVGNSGPIDFILVCSESSLRNSEKLACISTYVRNLEKLGLSVEFDVGVDFIDLVFLKVRGKNNLEKYAEAFNLNLSYKSYNYRLKPGIPFKFMATELTNPDPDGEIYHRATETCSGDRPTSILRSERIQIVYTLLMRSKFSDNINDYGINNLILKGILVAAYPLHDGTWMWNNNSSEPLNDRQLLMKFWGNTNMWYKQQPLNTIQYYFGGDVAYYFAYFGFYNKMLIYATVAGIISFTVSMIRGLTANNEIMNEACTSELILCPVVLTKNFSYGKLKDHCLDIKLIHIFDSPLTIAFAIFMSFWATVFICLWQRLHAMFMYRWNISFDDTYESRLEFEQNTPYRRVCEETNEVEAYIPKKFLFKNYSITFATCFTLACNVRFPPADRCQTGLQVRYSCKIAIVASVTIMLLMMRVFLIPIFLKSENEFLRTNYLTASSLMSSLSSVLFVKIFTQVYLGISLWLTRRENPRTQEEFDSSFIYKSFMLAFVNNYSSITYVAFMKGLFITHPGERLPEYKKDPCHHGGCMLGLGIELTIFMLLTSMFGSLMGLLLPVFTKWAENCYKYKRRYVATRSSRQWELEYNLSEIPEYFLAEQHLELIIQYGAVTFFVAAFPLGPLCAMINNCIKLRLDAYAFLRIYRRPVPIQGTRMSTFNNILKIMTFISAVTNAFVIGFTSNYVKRTLYKYQINWDLKGYVKYVHSEFAMKDYYAPDFADELKNHSNVICYYHDMRYPPDHPKKYQLTKSYWYQIAVRYVAVIVFEHVILVLNSALSHALPTIPYFIKKQVSYQRNKLKEETLKKLEGTKQISL